MGQHHSAQAVSKESITVPTYSSDNKTIKALELLKSYNKLELSNFRLDHIPPEVRDYLLSKKCTSLSEVGLFVNFFNELPWDVLSKNNKLKGTKTMDISYNKISKFPSDFSEKCGELERLSMPGNYFRSLESLSGLTNLSFLDARFNPIESLACPLFITSPLKTIKISNCGLKGHLPSEIFKIETLISLDASSNELTSVIIENNETFNCPKLKELILNQNKLTTLPRTLFCGTALPSIEVISVGENRITKLPDSITTLGNLQQFHAYDNQLQDLPKDIGNLQKMFVLDLCYNQIKNLPASFHTLNQLVSLDITRNQLTQFVNMDGWTKITDLFLSSNQLQNLDLFHISESCHRLARLSAGYNKIQSDHQKWSPNSKLQQLYLSGNVIKSMSFDNLQNLTVLFLSENELESIPQHLDQLLPMIRHLDFSCNKLTNVDALQQCTNERILSVNFCLNQVQDAHHYKPNHLLTEVTSHQISHKDPNQLAPHQSLYNTKVNSKWAFAHSIGPFRTSMEDSMVINNDITINDNLHLQLYAVFDGHAGENTAKFAAERLQPVVVNIFENKYAQLQTIDAQCAEQALCEALETIDKQSEQFSDGCTAVVVMIVNKNTCVAVNIGDARAVLGNVDGSVMRLTHDHKPSDPSERNRVLELGGVIIGGRINGYAVSRAIGDHFCRPFISSKPHTCLVDLNYGVHDLLVIACDGVWDVHSDLHAVEVVNQCLRENRSGDEQRDLFRAAQRLMGSSICDRSTDNISVILVKLDH